MGTQCRVRVVGGVDFAVIQVQYVTYVKTGWSRLTARHFYTVQKSATHTKKKPLNKHDHGIITIL